MTMKWIMVEEVESSEIFQLYYGEDGTKPEVPEGCIFVSEGEDTDAQEEVLEH